MARSDDRHRGDDGQAAVLRDADAARVRRPAHSGVRERAPSKVATRTEALDALEAREPCRTIEDIASRYKPAIWARLQRPTIPEDVAEDILVEVLVTMNDKLKKDGGVSPWLGRTLNIITTHHICNYVRWRKHQPILTSLDALETAPLPSSRSNPERALDRARRKAFVRRILDMMDDADRALVELVYFCGIPEVEVARELSIPAGTLRSRLHEARARFKVLAMPYRAELGGDP